MWPTSGSAASEDGGRRKMGHYGRLLTAQLPGPSR